MLRATEGHRNQQGIFVPGAVIETAVSLVSTPITGQERLTVAEGLRNEDIRTFYVTGDVVGLHYGLADEDLFVLGGLGQTQNRFSGTTKAEAEQVRDQYAIANPAWLTAYQGNVANVIQLRGFGGPVYQRYNPVDGDWSDTDDYRAYSTQRWGSFTQIMAIRRDPGN